MKQKYYVVWEGEEPGVYNTWDECKKQIHGFTDAKYMSFGSREEAMRAFLSPHENYVGVKKSWKTMDATAKSKFGVPDTNSISVDAACSGNPGKMEYRGVKTDSSEQIFHKGFEDGTNNIGEFLAIVHALALLKQQNNALPVYSDSKYAIEWVNAKKCNTKHTATRQNAKLFEVIARAEKWLAENTYPNPVLKWETEAWGEIPADFGRKN
ncbi:MAG: ribonuclease H family protein [Paludibacter sp.]|jgi:ribonuclease HI|nr:ribonuclease H family protein [Paludibacter sp.]